VSASWAQGQGRWVPVFQDNFQDGVKATNWLAKGDGIGLATREGGGKCARITRDSALGESYLVREFRGPGRFKFEALIHAEGVQGGGKTWTAGQFHAVIVDGTTEVAWPKDEFIGTFGFSLKSFETPALAARHTARLRIGIQDGTGTICVTDVRVSKLSE
jgi:hypothetical protein